MAVPKRRKAVAPKPTPAPKRTPTKSDDDDNVSVLVPVNKALKSAWEKQKQIILEASRSNMREWDRKYEAVAEVAEHNPPLYLAGGYADLQTFAAEFLHEDVRMLRDWMNVAKLASPDEEALYTPTRLALLLSLMRAQSKDGTLPKSVDWKKVRVPVVAAGAAKGAAKSALDATLDEIRAARRVAMHAGDKPANHESKEVDSVRRVMRGDALGPVKVQYRDGMYSFGAVPAYAIEDFARALLAMNDAPSKKKTKRS